MIYDDFLKWSMLKALQNFKKPSNMVIILKKIYAQVRLNSILGFISGTHNPSFGYLEPSLLHSVLKMENSAKELFKNFQVHMYNVH